MSTEPLILPEPSQQALDQALIAGRRVYSRDSPLNHSPGVIRMLDAAIEAALIAATPTLAAETLRLVSEETKTHYIMGTVKGKYTRTPHDVYVFSKDVRALLNTRADTLSPTPTTEED